MGSRTELAISSLLLLGLFVLAQWVWTLLGGDPPSGPLGYFTWAAYFAGAVIAFSILGSSAAGIWFLVDRVLHAEEHARDARKVKTRAIFFYVDAAGGKGPYALSDLRLVPSFALIDVEFRVLREDEPPVSEERLSAMREIVNDAVEHIKRDAAPETWVDALPEALARLGAHGLVLRGPRGGFHRYDPEEVPGKRAPDQAGR